MPLQNITGESTTILVPVGSGLNLGKAPILQWFVLTLDNTAGGTVTFEDTNGVALTANHYISAGSGLSMLAYDGPKIFAGNGLGIQLVNSAGNVGITYGYFYR